MAFLTKDQVREIITNAPDGTTPENVVKGLLSRGHFLEGFEENVQQTQTSSKPDITTPGEKSSAISTVQQKEEEQPDFLRTMLSFGAAKGKEILEAGKERFVSGAEKVGEAIVEGEAPKAIAGAFEVARTPFAPVEKVAEEVIAPVLGVAEKGLSALTQPIISQLEKVVQSSPKLSEKREALQQTTYKFLTEVARIAQREEFQPLLQEAAFLGEVTGLRYGATATQRALKKANKARQRLSSTQARLRAQKLTEEFAKKTQVPKTVIQEAERFKKVPGALPESVEESVLTIARTKEPIKTFEDAEKVFFRQKNEAISKRNNILNEMDQEGKVIETSKIIEPVKQAIQEMEAVGGLDTTVNTMRKELASIESKLKDKPTLGVLEAESRKERLNSILNTQLKKGTLSLDAPGARQALNTVRGALKTEIEGLAKGTKFEGDIKRLNKQYGALTEATDWMSDIAYKAKFKGEVAEGTVRHLLSKVPWLGRFIAKEGVKEVNRLEKALPKLIKQIRKDKGLEEGIKGIRAKEEAFRKETAVTPLEERQRLLESPKNLETPKKKLRPLIESKRGASSDDLVKEAKKYKISEEFLKTNKPISSVKKSTREFLESPESKVKMESKVEILPKDILLSDEFKKVGVKRISPDRVLHQQITPEEGIRKLEDFVSKAEKIIGKRIYKASKRVIELFERTENRIVNGTASESEIKFYNRAKKKIEIAKINETVKNILGKDKTTNFEKNVKLLKDNIKDKYVELVKKDISKGYKFPNEVLNYDKSFKTAVNNRERYEKGLRTSFSADDSRIVFDEVDIIGAGMKRQDGKKLNTVQKDDIVKGVKDFSDTLGLDMKKLAADNRWVYVHLNNKNPFLTKNAAGLYRKDIANKSISISVGGKESYNVIENGKKVKKYINTTMAHELGHAIDYSLNNKLFTNNDLIPLYRSYNPIENSFKSNAYWSNKQEITARMIAQYVAVKKGNNNIFHDQGYWNKEIYKNIIEPLVKKAIKENFSEFKLNPVK